MFDILTETFLYNYFLFSAVLGTVCDKKALFFRLGNVFCLSEEKLTDLFEATLSEALAEIAGENDFKRYKRIKQYNGLVGNKSCFSEAEDALIAVKGNALTVAAQYRLAADREATETLIVKNLMSYAEMGSVIALRVLGFIRCEGLIVTKDEKAGVKNLTKAMRWGDVDSALAMMRYYDSDKREVMKALNASVKDTPYEFLPEIVAESCGVSADEGCCENVSLIKKAISAARVKPDLYDPSVARVVFADTIDIKDKERIVFSDNEGNVSEACDLPLYLGSDELVVDRSAFGNAPENRESERKAIARWFDNSDLKGTDAFLPLCVCSDSGYLLDYYDARIGGAIKNAHIERIDVAELREFDFEPTKNNVFLRGLQENKNNVLILRLEGNIGEATVELVQAFLKNEKRKKFRLLRPTVSLDLSSVTVICLCDKENGKKFEGLADIVKLAPVKEAEKPDIVRDILDRKRVVYATGEITVADEVMDKLCAMSVEAIAEILDKIVQDNRKRGAALYLSVELTKPYFSKRSNGGRAYGFGGVINEND